MKWYELLLPVRVYRCSSYGVLDFLAIWTGNGNRGRVSVLSTLLDIKLAMEANGYVLSIVYDKNSTHRNKAVIQD